MTSKDERTIRNVVDLLSKNKDSQVVPIVYRLNSGQIVAPPNIMSIAMKKFPTRMPN